MIFFSITDSLLHHGEVPHFSYGRIVYFYALPNAIDDHQQISLDELKDIEYRPWKPIAYLGSQGYRFIQAEELLTGDPYVKVEKGNIWAEGKILFWIPEKKKMKLKLQFNCNRDLVNTHIGFTLCHLPAGGRISVFINGKPTKIDGKDVLDLFEKNQKILDNHFTGPLYLNKGKNEIIFESEDDFSGKIIAIDFIWLKDATM